MQSGGARNFTKGVQESTRLKNNLTIGALKICKSNYETLILKILKLNYIKFSLNVHVYLLGSEPTKKRRKRRFSL